jgi:hypothetical protein
LYKCLCTQLYEFVVNDYPAIVVPGEVVKGGGYVGQTHVHALAKLLMRVHPTQIFADLVVIEGSDILEHPTLTRAPLTTVPRIKYSKYFYLEFC